MGAMSAEPGQRMKGARTGGLLGLVGGEIAGAGTKVIGALQRPGGILALKGVVPELQGRVTARAAEVAREFSEAEKRTGAVFDDRLAAIDEAAKNMSDAVSTRADKAESLFTSEQGPRVAQKVRGLFGVDDKIDEALALADKGKEEVRALYYSKLDDQFANITHQPTLEYLRSDELKSAVRAIAPNVLKGKGLSFQQLQELRSRFQGGRFADPAIARRLNNLMTDAIGPDLATADQAWAGFSAFQRGAKEGQASSAWPASRVRRRLEKVPPAFATGFREGRLADLTQKIQQKGEGTPYLQRFLDGGPEMDERLATIFPEPDKFNAVKAVIAEEKAALNAALQKRNTDLAKLGNQRSGLFGEMQSAKDAALQAIGANREAEAQRFSSMNRRLSGLEIQREILQASAERTARRIRAVFIAGATVAGATTAYRLGNGLLAP